MAEAISVSAPVTDGEGKSLSFETGKLAAQAGGSVTVRLGDTVVLVTATGAKKPREGADFFPLTVDIEERMYAAGRIPGSFFRREGKASDQAILTCRLIDRPLRPCFPDGFRNEVHVVGTVLAAFMGASWLAQTWARSESSPGTQYLGLGLYVVAEAIIFMPILWIAMFMSARDPAKYGNMVPMAAILTLMIFGGLTMSAFLTRKDFSFLAPILSVACWLSLGLIVCAIILKSRSGSKGMFLMSAGFEPKLLMAVTISV